MTQHHPAVIETLDILLAGNVSPELLGTYKDIALLLDKVNFTAHLDELDLLVGMITDQDLSLGDVVMSTDCVLRTAVGRALTMIGVEFIEESTDTTMLYIMADALLDFKTTDVPEAIYNAVDGADDDLSALLRILSYLTAIEEYEWMTIIKSVSHDTVEKMKDIAFYDMERLDREIIDDAVRLKRIARISSLKPDTIAGEAIGEGKVSDASLESMYNVYVPRLIDLSVESGVEEIYCLAALTDTSLESLEAQVTIILDDLYFNPNQRSEAERIRGSIRDALTPIFSE